MTVSRTVRLMFVTIAALLLAVPAHMAAAQQSSPGAGYLGKARSEYAIFVFGDSLAAGLWAGSQRVIRGNPRLKIKGRFKEGSGLARPRFHDWASAMPKIIESNPMDIAIVLLGANDSQPVRLADKTLEFGSPEWTEYYAGQVDKIIRVLKSSKIAVYWVELPPMGSETHEAAVKTIAKIHRDRMAAAGVRVVDTRKILANEDGTYTNMGFGVDGQFRRLRSTDGFHFLKSGNTKIAKLVVDAINEDIEVSDGLREPDSVAAVDLRPGDPSAKPLFGHSLSSGGDFIIPSDELPKAGAIAVVRNILNRSAQGADGSNALSSEDVINNLRASAAPDSRAGRLFTDGEWPDAPAGRFDNFSWPEN